jgi:hypothetical protein
VLRKLILALLSIPEIRMLIQEEMMRRQVGQLGPTPLEPQPPEEGPRPAGPRKSFADKLAELRARS